MNKHVGYQATKKNLLKSQDVAYASAALDWIRFRFRFQFRIPRILHESSRIGQLRYLYAIDTRVSVRVCSCGNQQCSRSRALPLSLSISCSVSLAVRLWTLHFSIFNSSSHGVYITFQLLGDCITRGVAAAATRASSACSGVWKLSCPKVVYNWIEPTTTTSISQFLSLC